MYGLTNERKKKYFNDHHTDHSMAHNPPPSSPERELARIIADYMGTISKTCARTIPEAFEPIKLCDQTTPMPPPTRFVRKKHPKKMQQSPPKQEATATSPKSPVRVDHYDDLFAYLATQDCGRCGRDGHKKVDCYVMDDSNGNFL